MYLKLFCMMIPISMTNKGIKTGYDSLEYEDFDDGSSRFVYDFPHTVESVIGVLWHIGERNDEDWEEEEADDLWFY